MQGKKELNDITRLRNLKFFSKLDIDILEKFKSNCIVWKAEKGEVIFHEGQISSSMYFIETGLVEISKQGVHLAILGPGDYFGEMSVLGEDDHVRSATAEVLEDLVIFQIDLEFIRDYFLDEKIPLYDLILTYNKRLKKHNDVVVDQYIQLQKSYEKLEHAHQQLLMTEKLASIGTLTAGIAHEINNPLAVILGYCNMFVRQEELLKNVDPLLKKGIGHIDKAANAVAKIVREIKNYARTNQDEMIPMNLNNIIQASLDLVSFLYRTNKIELKTDFSDEVIELVGNPGNLQQVVFNLLSNAKDALEKVENVKKEIWVRTKKRSSQVEIIFEDNGCGIPKENMEKIFEPFFTTKEMDRGTGLGLDIIRKIVEKMKGEITVESTIGKGTAFHIVLPSE